MHLFRTFTRASAWPAAALIIACLGTATVHAETFNLDIHTYCPPSPSFCGYGSYGAYVHYLREAIQELNLQWEPNGISFRPGYIPVPLRHPTSSPPGASTSTRTTGWTSRSSSRSGGRTWRRRTRSGYR